MSTADAAVPDGIATRYRDGGLAVLLAALGTATLLLPAPSGLQRWPPTAVTGTGSLTEWRGELVVWRRGSYRFDVVPPDSATIFVDGVEVFPATPSDADVPLAIGLSTGPHRVALRTRLDTLQVPPVWRWGRSTAAPDPVPTWVVFDRPVAPVTMLASRLVWLLFPLVGLLLCLSMATRTARWLRPAFYSSTTTRPQPRYPMVSASLVMNGIIVAVTIFPANTAWQLTQFSSETLGGMWGGAALLAHSPHNWLARLNTPGAGENEVLSPVVLAMRAQLERYDIERFRMTTALVGDGWVQQQLVTAAWPRLNEPTAPWLFLLADEQLPTSCALVDSHDGVQLAYCR